MIQYVHLDMRYTHVLHIITLQSLHTAPCVKRPPPDTRAAETLHEWDRKMPTRQCFKGRTLRWVHLRFVISWPCRLLVVLFQLIVSDCSAPS